MKILKIQAKGLNLFSDEIDIDFTTIQRVRNEKNEMLYKLSPKIYQNNAISFVGINASGKTTALKVISFVIQMLNNEPINRIEYKDILNKISEDKKVIFNIYFMIESSDKIYKLNTVIGIDHLAKDLDKKYIIEHELICSKNIKSIKTKKSMFDFKTNDIVSVRKGNEEYLPNDISIIISLNKKFNELIFFRDLISYTNINFLSIIGELPIELVTFLDSSIEYLNSSFFESDNEKMKIKLKFKGKEEITLNSPLDLDRYLSSGTIKGINVFISAMLTLNNGGYLIIDELENHFNKEIAITLIEFFMSSKINKKGAVIIFSTHYSELLDEFERNDSIYIVRNKNGINLDNLSNLLKRNDFKKSEIYQSGYLGGTSPSHDAYKKLKNYFSKFGGK